MTTRKANSAIEAAKGGFDGSPIDCRDFIIKPYNYQGIG
jgi:hypothetical protein